MNVCNRESEKAREGARERKREGESERERETEKEREIEKVCARETERVGDCVVAPREDQQVVSHQIRL